MSRLAAVVIAAVVILAAAAAGFLAMTGARAPVAGTPTAAQSPKATPVQTSPTPVARTTEVQTSPATTPAPVQTSPTPALQLPEKIVIGVAVSLSGRFAEPGTYGFHGILAAVKWVNEVRGGVRIGGRALHLEVKHYDDQSSKDLAISLVERLITVDKVNFLLGPYTSPITFAAASIPERHGMLMVNWGGASDAINEQGYKMIVTTWAPASTYFWSTIDMVRALDPSARKVAIVHASDEFSALAGRGAYLYALRKGLEVAYFRQVPAEIKDVTPVLTELKAAGPDVILIAAQTDLSQLFTKQMIDLNVNAKLVALTIAPCYQSYYEAFRGLAEGIACPSQWEPEARWGPELARRLGYEWFGPTPQEFVRLFQSVAPGKVPTYHAGSGAAAVLLLVRAIEEAQSLDPAKVRQAFNKISGKVMALLGPFEIDPLTGKLTANIVLTTQWQGGKRVIVWPQDAATSRPYYPIPTWSEKQGGKQAVP